MTRGSTVEESRGSPERPEAGSGIAAGAAIGFPKIARAQADVIPQRPPDADDRFSRVLGN